MTLKSKEITPKSVRSYNAWNGRILVLLVIFGLCCLTLIGGLGYRQIILNKDYLQKEEHQSLRRILQPGSRGNIYDRHGNLLVGNRPRFAVVAYLNELRGEFRKEYMATVKKLKTSKIPFNRHDIQKQSRARVLQRYLDHINQLIGRTEPVNAKELERHFHQRILLPLPLINDLTPEEFAKLTEQLPVEYPIQLYTDSSRFYPYGSSASHTIGYVVSAPEPTEETVLREDLTTFTFKGKVGKSGLENSFDWLLQGECGGEIWRVDPAGFQYEQVSKKVPVQGNHLVTSLDIHIQQAAEKALGDKTGAVIMMEVKTGEVLAIASTPDYNLNELTPYIPSAVYDKINEAGGWLNRATQGLYPPGSIFKMMTAITAFRQGVASPGDSITCTGKYPVGTRNFPCNRRWGHGDIDIKDTFKMSCNHFFYHWSQQINIHDFTAEMRRFGFDQPTGIEIPYETKRMLVPTPEWKKKRALGPWYGGDSANMSIGQGYLLLTPMNMVCFGSSLARGETRTKPTIIHNSETTKRVDHGGEPIGISDAAMEDILEGMKRSAENGLARRVKVDGLSIAAKTGTAQTTYKGKDLDVVWLLGFAPADNPEVAVVVMVEELDENEHYYGSTIAAPIGKLVLEEWWKGKKRDMGSS